MKRFPLDDIDTFVRQVFCSYGVAEDDARIAAKRMLEADLRGQSAHGIFRLPGYARRLELGGYNLRPRIRSIYETPVSSLVNGDNGLGQVVMTCASQIAVKKALANGLAWVGVRNSNHAGAGGVYASMALEHDMIGVYMAVGSANHLPPWGGTDRLLSTNPLAIAIPAGEEPPVVLDMATTVASYGKIKVAAERGENIPEGWLEDQKGQPIIDPKRSGEGFLLPIGGYKGYGLSLVIGLLAGVMNGAAFGSDVVDYNQDFQSITNTGHTIVMVRPDLFGPMETFKATMDRKIREIKNSTPMEGRAPVRVPGDLVPERERHMRLYGIEIGEGTVNKLVELGKRTGVDTTVFH